MSDRQRLFIGARLPGELAASLAGWQSQLARVAPDVNWEPRERLHLTLRFLGDTDPDLVPTIGEALIRATADRASPHLRLAEPGGFPNRRDPRVLWIGLLGDLPSLAALREEVERRLVDLGLPRDTQPWHPHVTVGRLRRTASRPQRRAAGNALESVPAPVGGWRLTAVTLFRSVQERGTARHLPLWTVELAPTE